jgi:hypothetical protein
VGSGCTVVVACLKCRHTKSYEIAHLIETLGRVGAGDGNTSVLKVAKTIRGRCPNCRQQAWKADLVWPKAPGQGNFHADPMPKRA